MIDPGKRQSLAGQPVITVASDLHNNAFGIPVLQRIANNGPVFFVGDLTDRGSPLETRLVAQAAHSGKPFVFVSGNHDSDYLARELATDGAIVLTRTGRLKPDGSRGPIINTIKPGIARRGLRRPVRAPLGRLVQGPLRQHAEPGDAGRVPEVADAADRQGRRRDGPRARR